MVFIGVLQGWTNTLMSWNGGNVCFGVVEYMSKGGTNFFCSSSLPCGLSTPPVHMKEEEEALIALLFSYLIFASLFLGCACGGLR